MQHGLKQVVKGAIRRLGFDIVRYPPPLPLDFDAQTIDTLHKVLPFTQTSPERIFGLCQAVRHVVRHQIPGSVVECGVWRGGSMMAAALTLLQMGESARDLYLFDTFEGMTAPGAQDVSHDNVPASVQLKRSRKEDSASVWCYSPLEEVQQTLYRTGYPQETIHFVKGRVEDTLPARAPERIALLRLDTDWYESTHHELLHLFPRISPGGILIIDDYGHWRGARQAVDEYIRDNKLQLFLHRMDYSGRIAIVPG